jgi:predicted DNA-binding transcriptional regulator AlpA
MRKQGPPWVKIGRVARYAVSAVNAWIEKQQKG